MSRLAGHITDALQPAVGLVLERLCVSAYDCDIQIKLSKVNNNLNHEMNKACVAMGWESATDLYMHTLKSTLESKRYYEDIRSMLPGIKEDDSWVNKRRRNM
jgi:hypothetical protein